MNGRFITVKTFQAQQRNDQNVLSSVELIQNISKINPKYMQRDLAKKSLTENTQTYTDTKMIKIQKTSRFFYAPFLFWILGNNKDNYMEQIFKTSSGASTGLSTPYCWDLQEWGSDTILYTLKLSCDKHLAKLLSTINCKT